MTNNKIADLATIYAALGDASRLSIMVYLLNNPTNVTSICQDLMLSQPNVSHHLRILKDSKLVKATKNGKNIIYAICDEHVEQIIKLGLTHMEC